MNKGTTYDIPPPFPTFDFKSSVSANKKNLVQATPTQSTPIIIQLPSQYYQNSAFQVPYGNTNNHLVSSLDPCYKLPSIGEFLSNLDQKYNCDNVYAKFEEAFREEEITVNVIKDLSDEQLQKLGVVKIGWQKNIKQAAHQF